MQKKKTKRKTKRTLTKTRVNREHKDRLFRLIFGREENKQNLLDLYNALNNTRYKKLADLEITTQTCLFEGLCTTENCMGSILKKTT